MVASIPPLPWMRCWPTTTPASPRGISPITTGRRRTSSASSAGGCRQNGVTPPCPRSRRSPSGCRDPGPMTRQIVENNVDISLRRMAVERLDLLQFHWWEYRDKRYLDALEQLAALRDEGKIHRVALTNFDTERLREIADHGVRVVSNQVQYSLIDRRPEVRMSQVCEEQRVWLLPYGVLCGGLLSDRYLGQPEPGPGRAEHRQPAQVQADDRRLGRLAAFPATAFSIATHRRQARGQHRQRGGALYPGKACRGRRDHRRAAWEWRSTSPKTPGSSASALDDDDNQAIETVSGQRPRPLPDHRRLRRRIPPLIRRKSCSSTIDCNTQRGSNANRRNLPANRNRP